jgi:hypothetical protein
MARPRIDSWYSNRIATYAAEGLRPAAIRRQLEADARDQDRADVPSERTVRRLYEQFQMLPPESRRDWMVVRWPDSFSSGALPWASARVVFDLLKYYDQQADWGLPTVRQARWFWYLRLASPSIPVDHANNCAYELALIDLLREDPFGAASPDRRVDVRIPDNFHWQLMYEPWKDSESRAASEEMLRVHPDRDWDRTFSQELGVPWGAHPLAPPIDEIVDRKENADG